MSINCDAVLSFCAATKKLSDDAYSRRRASHDAIERACRCLTATPDTDDGSEAEWAAWRGELPARFLAVADALRAGGVCLPAPSNESAPSVPYATADTRELLDAALAGDRDRMARTLSGLRYEDDGGLHAVAVAAADLVRSAVDADRPRVVMELRASVAAAMVGSGLTAPDVLREVGDTERLDYRVQTALEALCGTSEPATATDTPTALPPVSTEAPPAPPAAATEPASNTATGAPPKPIKPSPRAKLSLDAQALAIFADDPSRKTKDIAAILGCTTQNLAPKRCPRLHALMTAHKRGNAPPRGSKSDGNVEAWTDE